MEFIIIVHFSMQWFNDPLRNLAKWNNQSTMVIDYRGGEEVINKCRLDLILRTYIRYFVIVRNAVLKFNVFSSCKIVSMHLQNQF